jgi:hypothetical protein
MELNMKEIMSWGRNMEKENLIGLMSQYMKEDFLIIIFMVKVNMDGLMDEITLVDG